MLQFTLPDHMPQRTSDQSKSGDFLFHEMQLIHCKVVRHIAALRTIQLQQLGDILQIEAEGLSPLDETNPLHIALAILSET